MRYALAAALGAIGINPVALATCIGPVGADERPAAWSDLRDHVPAPVAGVSVLAIGAQTGEINNDFYAITIDSAGQTPAQLAKELRSDFNAIVFTRAPVGNLRQRYRDRNPRDQKVISRRIAFS